MKSKAKLISNISRVRNERGLSQRQLAKCVSVSHPTIVSWERSIPSNFRIAFDLESFFRPEIERLFDSNSLIALQDIAALRKARRLGELSQAKLAEFIGVSENTISTWETGKHKTMSKLEKLCCCLECNLTDLYEEDLDDVFPMPSSRAKQNQSNVFSRWLKPSSS